MSDYPMPTTEDAETWLSKYTRWKYVPPLPNESMMYHIGAPNVENFYVVAEAWAYVLGHYLQPNSHVLDMGCGCGRTARLLALNPHVERLTGFDVILPYIQWCDRFFGELFPERFKFHHLDVRSERYNPDGKFTCQTARFPTDDQGVDIAFAASLFTHLFPEDARAYLQELRRVLKDEGKAVISFHEEPQAGQFFSGSEVRADYETNYFLQMVREEGFDIFEDIGELCGQRTVVLTKR
jgi:SAM-dependent methyltransferase